MYVAPKTYRITNRPAGLWLAAADGRRLPVPRPASAFPENLVERQMIVHFEGISESQQRAALAAFPGGRRFLLSSGPCRGS